MKKADWNEKRCADGLILGVAVLMALIVSAVLLHPASMRDSGSWSLIKASGLLIAYTTAGLWARYQAPTTLQKALTIGTVVGCIFGVVEMANIAIESSPWAGRGIVPPLAMALMPFLFGAAASIAEERTRSVKIAVYSGLWCGLVGSLIACIFGLAFNLKFMRYIVLITSIHGGTEDPGATVVRNTLESASSHLTFIPALALFLSLVSGLFSAALRTLRQSALVVLATLQTLLVASSIVAIRYALSLERSARPPIIGTGMLIAAIALTCAWPIFGALGSLHFRPKSAGSGV